MSFVERHGLWSKDQVEAAGEVRRRIEAERLTAIRFSFADQHGILRGKTIVAGEAPAMMVSGCGIASTLLLKDTAHRTVVPIFAAGENPLLGGMRGASDVVMVPDPTSFRALPWAPGTGWLLCDIHFADGRPVPYSTRHVMRGLLGRLAATGHDFVAGLEVEFHIFKLADERPDDGDDDERGGLNAVPLNSGYQYLTELRYDELDPILDLLRRDLLALRLPLRSLEIEFGPSQCELTFGPQTGLDPADAMVLMRSAVKQVCRRNRYHATFMCRPRIDKVMSSGWHLHQSLRVRKDGANAFASTDGEPLSPMGGHFLAGLLSHAAAATAFSTPTINGYKRYAPNSLAPDRAVWGCDNRGAMVRVIGPPGDPATRLENRVGEPAANPYLYLASQIAAGLDGIARKLDPGPPADAPYETNAPLLPRSLHHALAALREDACFLAAFGQSFIDYYCLIKEAELARFDQAVTDWEQREYFEIF